jgi:hypothetical protein
VAQQQERQQQQQQQQQDPLSDTAALERAIQARLVTRNHRAAGAAAERAPAARWACSMGDWEPPVEGAAGVEPHLRLPSRLGHLVHRLLHHDGQTAAVPTKHDPSAENSSGCTQALACEAARSTVPPEMPRWFHASLPAIESCPGRSGPNCQIAPAAFRGRLTWLRLRAQQLGPALSTSWWQDVSWALALALARTRGLTVTVTVTGTVTVTRSSCC